MDSPSASIGRCFVLMLSQLLCGAPAYTQGPANSVLLQTHKESKRLYYVELRDSSAFVHRMGQYTRPHLGPGEWLIYATDTLTRQDSRLYTGKKYTLTQENGQAFLRKKKWKRKKNTAGNRYRHCYQAEPRVFSQALSGYIRQAKQGISTAVLQLL